MLLRILSNTDTLLIQMAKPFFKSVSFLLVWCMSISILLYWSVSICVPLHINVLVVATKIK